MSAAMGMRSTAWAMRKALAALLPIAILFVFVGIAPQPVKAAESAGEFWAVIIGISDYQHVDDVFYADDGAQELYQRLSPIWGQDHVKLLLNSRATKADILAAIDWLAEKDSTDDTVLFYFAGHGEPRGLIAPHDANFEATWISRSELDNCLDTLNSERVVIILDTCHAGLYEGSLAGNGRVVLMSSRSNESAYEHVDLKQAVFTHYLLQGIETFDGADANHDYELSVEELYKYAGPKTTSFITGADEIQHPMLSDGYQGELGLLVKFIFKTDSDIPSGTQVLFVDNKPYTSSSPPLIWAAGSTHRLEVTPLVNKGLDTRYMFTSWDDGDTSVSRAASRGVHTANYKTQYYLSVESEYGEASGAGWYDSGSKATISVTPSAKGALIRRVVTGWSDGYNRKGGAGELLMDGPKTVVAEWGVDYTRLYVLIAMICTVVCAIIYVLGRTRRKGWQGIPHEISLPRIPIAREPLGQLLAIEPAAVVSPEAALRLILPDSSQISFAGSSRTIGRADFSNAVSTGAIKYISRRHFLIGFESGKSFIEDLNSTNGTKANGVEIRGRGKQELRDGDRIEIADRIALTFKKVDY